MKKIFKVSPGKPHPLGATPDKHGVNFAVFSQHATLVELLLFEKSNSKTPCQVIPLDPTTNKTYNFWHVYVHGLSTSYFYAYRVDGPNDLGQGFRFNKNKILIDPYSKGIDYALWKRADAAGEDDNLSTSLRSAIIDMSDYNWEKDKPLHHPIDKTIVYELHVGNFTKSPTSHCKHPGKFRGVIEKIPYLKSLGVTAVELMPVMDFDSREGKNVWGYGTIGFFAPECSYCTKPSEASHVRDFRDLVKAFHKAGIEVILDAVFGYTAEGDHQGLTLSFRGFDNTIYYMLSNQDKQYYMNYSGCGNRIKVSIPIDDHIIYAQGWLYNDGTIPVYLLDTNIEENDPKDRSIVDLLYIVDQELRIKQEIILGIGGVKLLHSLGITPSVYHMNEGHSAFLVYELSKIIMSETGLPFSEAFDKAREKIAFTCHTLVVGAHDAFDYNLVNRMVSPYSMELGVAIDEFVQKGISDIDNNNTQDFSTISLAFQSAIKVNAVSKLHSIKAKETWENCDMFPLTNGINLKRWDKVGQNNDIAQKHQENKSRLLALIKKEKGVKWNDGDLLIGWARRITGYKRPISFFDNLETAKNMLSDKDRPIRLVVSGYPHYSDQEGHWYLDRIRKLAQGELKDKIVFLENYSTKFSTDLVSGCDVWLNTPIVGLEACGTSTMKAALNGTLLCSTNDGWLPEIDLNAIGFELDNDVSNSLPNVLINQLVPLFYTDKEKWKKKMLSSRQTIVDNYGSDRMLKDYIEQVYQPILLKQFSATAT